MTQYQIHVLGPIGKGSFGIVEKAIWRGTAVAIKTVPIMAEKQQEKVLREIESQT